MLKLLLGHWHIHRKKPLLLPPEAELFAEGHNDQNPVNRINPLYEATDSDELNSILSVKNDAQLTDSEKAKNTEKNELVLVQDGEPSEVRESVSEKPPDIAQQKKDQPSTTNGESSGLFPVNLSAQNHDGADKEDKLDSETNNIKELHLGEQPSETPTENKSFEKSDKAKINAQEKSNFSVEVQDSEDHAKDSKETEKNKLVKDGDSKPEKHSQETRIDIEISDKEVSPDNSKAAEKSGEESVINNNLQSSVGENDVAQKSKVVTTTDSCKKILPEAGALETKFRSDSTENSSGAVTNDFDEVSSSEEKPTYSANWVNIESNVGKGKSSKGNAKKASIAMGITREMESTHEPVSSAAKSEANPSSGIFKSSLKVRAKAIDELIKKFQPTSSDGKDGGQGKIGKVSVHKKKQAFSPSRTRSEELKENPEPPLLSKKSSVAEKSPEITFPPPPPPEPPTSSVVLSSKVEKNKGNKVEAGEESGLVRTAVSSVKPTPSSSKSIQTSTGPASSFLFNGKNGETKTTSSRTEEAAKTSKKVEESKPTSSKKVEESKPPSSSAVNHGRFKKNERSIGTKRSFDTDESSHPNLSSKAVQSQNDEMRDKKSGLASKESEKPKLSKQSVLKQSSALDKSHNPRTHATKKPLKNDEPIKTSDDVAPLKKEIKALKTTNSASEGKIKVSETVTSGAKENHHLTRNSEWPSVKDKVDQVNKMKLQSNENGDVSPKSDSLLGKSQSEDSGITRGDQISSDSQVSEKLQEPSDAHQTKDLGSKPAGDNTNKPNTNVPSPKSKPRHTKERKRLQKHGHHGVTCKHCKRIKQDFLKSSGLSKGNCDDYYDKVIMEGLPVHRHIRRPDSWASDMSWEEFAERDYIAHLRREERIFDKHKHLNSSFKKRLAKQRHLHRDPFHQKIHHSDEVFSHPDPYKNGISGRHHRSHRRQSSLSDDNSSLHFDPYYSRTPSVCSCEDCWAVPQFTQVNFGRSSVRSRMSDWNYNDVCTCHIIPDLLEHRRKVKFAENHSTHKEELETTKSEEDEEAHSGSFGSAERASSLSDGNSRSHTSAEDANDDAKSSSSASRKEKTTENGSGPKGDSKVNEQYPPHPWELEEWDRLMRHRLLKKRRRRAMCMGVMALAMVVFIGLVVAIVMVYLRRKML